MPDNSYRFFGLLLFFFLYPLQDVSTKDYFFKRISLEQGLSHSGVNCILRDFNGALWAGTRQGLNRVDRNDLKSYFHDGNNRFSIPGNYIYNLHEDEKHNLWVISDGGLSLYDRERDRFETKIVNRIQSSVNIVGGALFGGYSAIYFYSYAKNTIERLPLINKDKAASYKDYFISQMIALDKKTILVGTEDDGIFFYDIDTYEFRPFGAKNNHLLQSLFFDPHAKEIYVSAFQNGLFCYDLTGKIKRHYTADNSDLSNNIILDIKKYNDKIWLATDGSGIDLLDPHTGKFENIKHIPGDVNSLPVNSITVLYSDCDNNLWAGTVRDGLFLFKETYIRTYKDVVIGSNKGLAERAVISLCEDKRGNLWIGTDGGGINMFNPYTENFEHHAHTYGDKVSSITDYSDTMLLVSLYGKGLFTYHIPTQRYRPFIILDEQTNIDECLSGFTPICHKIRPDKILILAKNAYIYHLDTHSFEKLRYAQGVPKVSALQLAYNDDDLSLLTKGSTIYMLKHNDGIIKQLLTLGEKEYVNSVCYDKVKDRLWIASAEGLKYYEMNTGRLTKIETSMFSRISYMYLDTKRDQLWINASNMLFSYDIHHARFAIWDDSDGFLPNNILTLYVKPSASDYIYMGGSNGLVKIDKRINAADDGSISFKVQDVELDGKVYLGRSLMSPRALRVPQNYSSLKIRVGLNEKDLFRRILFRYKISNHGNNSIIESYSNILDLASLAPGKYELYVSCMTRNGNWTEDSNLLTFEVIPPWYKRTGFTVISVGIILGIVALSVFLLLKKNKRKLEWKMAIHRQELNEDKIQFLTNVSHELRTPLTLIYGPLKRMLSSGEMNNSNQTEKIENIYRQANHMKGIIDWVLDYDRHTNLIDGLNLSFVDLNDLLRKTAGDFEHEFQEKGVHVKFDLNHQMDPIELDEAKIRVVISNLLMNALKFTHPGSEVILKTTVDNKKAHVQVKDGGIGLKDEDISRMFTRFYQGQHGQKGSGIGLSYCKELVERHGGRIGAVNNIGQDGVTFYFELPYHTTDTNISTKERENKKKPVELSVPYSELAEKIDTSSYTVLLVDDNNEFLQYLESELKPYFRKILKAKNGVEALIMLKERQPDILISDVAMPAMNGYELCKNVKTMVEISHIPVILLTAKSDKDSKKIGYKLGADSYLSKPFDIDLLLSVIQNQLKNKEMLKQKYQESSFSVSPENLTISNADEQFMTKLNQLIDHNYSDPDFDVAVVIDKIAMSRASLYSKLKNITGLGVNDYINKYRITIARALLTETDKSIADIAFETGFASQRYFSMAFKKNTGKTPSNYRISTKESQNDI